VLPAGTARSSPLRSRRRAAIISDARARPSIRSSRAVDLPVSWAQILRSSADFSRIIVGGVWGSADAVALLEILEARAWALQEARA